MCVTRLTALAALVTVLSVASVCSVQLKEHHARTFFKLAADQAIPKHDVIHPVQRHPKTRHVLSHSTSVPAHRQRRSSSPSEHADLMQPVDYSFNAFGQNFYLHLQNNYQLLSDDFSATVLHEDGHNETIFDFPLCYYHGTVTSHDESPVAISNCEGLNGAMYINDQRLTIEPLPAGMVVTEYNGTGEPHVVSMDNRMNNKSSDESNVETDRCFTQPEDEPVEVAPEYVTLSRGTESTHPQFTYTEAGPDGEVTNRTRRDVDDGEGTSGARQRNTKYALEVMLVLDQAMVRKRKFRSAAQANNYALSLANLASAHFNKGMLGIDLRFVVVRVLVVNRTQDGLRVGHHSVKALRSFCQWQERSHYSPWDNHPNHYDLAILVTGNELCPHQDNAGCAELGRAYVGGACYRYRMCSITYDYGMGTGFVMAHETGHSLNLTHDGQRLNENRCSSESGTLMTAVVAGGKNVYSWSQCSKREVRRFAESGQAYCLQDMPTRNLTKPQDMVGRRYSADDQCKLWLGQSSGVCRFSYTKNKICSELWCKSSNNYCRTTHVPAAMGTACGSGKVCYLGECVRDTFPRGQSNDRDVVRPAPRVVTPRQRPPARTYAPPVVRTTRPVPPTVRPTSPPRRTAPRWGDWLVHGGCSRTCGAGIQFYVRRCYVGSTIVGFQNCKGSWYRYTLCNTDDCPLSVRGHYLEDQCKRVGQRSATRGTDETWFPGYMAATRCALHCVSSRNRTFNSIVENGTPCSYRFNDRCVSGKCKPFGCDNKLQSSVVWDKCGVCGGNGSTCKQYTGIHRPDAGADSNTTVIRIPKGSRSIFIKEGAAIESSFIYVRFMDGRVAMDGAWMQGKKQDTLRVFLAGTEFTYKQSTRRPDVLTSSIAPINEDMVVELVRRRQTSQSIHWRFFLNPADQDTSYHWHIATTPCSVTCGKGVISSAILCVKRGTKTPVKDAYCSTVSTKPKPVSIPCGRPPCPASGADWVIRSWNPCSKSCGKGSQWRRVPCQLLGRNVHKANCIKPRPRTSRKCNPLPCPPEPVHGQWSDFSPYSACSRSCGGGVQYRRRTCSNPEPSNGGQFCVGPSMQAQLCETTVCDSSNTYRAGQCATYNRRSRSADNYRWIPHNQSLSECKLVCTPTGSNQPVVKKSRAADGTRCHPVLNNRCIFGICRTIGCDNVINSNKVEDRCGVCGGNGTRCVDAAGRYFVKHVVAGQYRVATIPKGARYLNISKSSRSLNTSLVLALANGQVILASEILAARDSSVSRFEPLLSTYTDYRREAGEREQIRIIGPLSDSVTILLNVSSDNRGNPHLRFEYTIGRESHRLPPASERYTWSRVTSACSATCGQGVALLVPRCYQKRDGEMVDNRYCRSLRQPAPHATKAQCSSGVACPEKYKYKWRIGAWSTCSSSCGPGVQSRSRHCIQSPGNTVVANRECRRNGLGAPNRRQSCQGNACIPAATWSIGAWASCSVTCGTGRQTREVSCRRYRIDQQCTGAAPMTSRQCRPGSCPQTGAAPQCEDRQSPDFCKLVVTYGLCTENTEYYRLCCRRCTEANRRGR